MPPQQPSIPGQAKLEHGLLLSTSTAEGMRIQAGEQGAVWGHQGEGGFPSEPSFLPR